MVDDTRSPSTAPSILVVFGATGDLMARKLAPSLHHLYRLQLCPDKFTVVGVARSSQSDSEFRQFVRDNLDRTELKEDTEASEQFLQSHSYHEGDFTEPDMYHGLKRKLEAIDDEWGVCTNKLFYLAVPPQHYETIFQNLHQSGLDTGCNDRTGWTRILVEKPIGHSKQEAERIEERMASLFEEEQIYRIDHYLGKEPLQNLPYFRFANNLLEHTWNRESVERVDIKLREDIDVEGRGAFYDQTGALLDVGQNHLLQMLALTAMPQPADMSADGIREARADILESLSCPDPNEQIRGQYQSFLHEPGVDPDSRTETYFKLQAYLDHPEWKGVPFYLESGKRMPSNDKRIVVTYRHPRECLCSDTQHYRNEVHIRLSPNPGIAIKLWGSRPRNRAELQSQWLEFNYPPETSTRYTAEYTDLLLNALKGNLELFVSKREHLASWRFIDPISAAWREDASEVPTYTPDSAEELDRFHPPSHEHPETRAVGVVGLGKMGSRIAARLSERGWDVTGYDPQPPENPEIPVAASVKELVEQLPTPRTIWMMVPHRTVDDVLFEEAGLASLLEDGDTVIDGGNSFYKHTVERADRFGSSGIRMVDAGVSGGPDGARNGASIMVGGSREDFARLEMLFADLAVPGGYAFFEGVGAGHFVKMIHNGIEYGMMQAIAEGFTLLKNTEYDLDLTLAADVYNHGSVIESRLIGWLGNALHVHGAGLEAARGSVPHTGEGEWTIDTAKETGIEARVIEDALRFREQSETNPSYTGRILRTLRHQFGGHDIA